MSGLGTHLHLPATPVASPRVRSNRALSFDQLGAMNDADIEPLVGAWLMARDVYPGLELHTIQDALDELALPLFDKELAKMRPIAQAHEISSHLYGALGFGGNKIDYYDPKNSLLPDVLRRKTGIPISLALVYCEVAKRVGVVANGVSFPGHFLVRIETDGSPLLVDPFNDGALLDQAALQKMLRNSSSSAHTVNDEHLAKANARAQLMRMLINLKWIYSTRGDHGRTMLTLTRMLALAPDAAGALRERALVAEKLGARELVRDDLAKLVKLQPVAAKDETVASAMAAAKREAVLN